MKKKYVVIYLILFFILLKCGSSFFINEIFISKYEKGEYKESLVKTLLFINISEPYIAHYNYGNVLYKNNDYDKAIEEYNKALKLFPTHDKECNIRINLALAMLKKIDENDTSEENINKTLQVLKEAKNVLIEKGCAGENNGHNKTAQKLKEEIEEKEKSLQNREPEDDTKNKKENDNKEKKDDKKNELRKVQKQVIEQRQSEMEGARDLSDFSYYGGKTW